MDLFERNILIGEDDELDEIILIVYGIPRRIYNRREYFYSFDELTFFRRFRVTKNTVLFILNEIEGEIEHPYDL